MQPVSGMVEPHDGRIRTSAEHPVNLEPEGRTTDRSDATAHAKHTIPFPGPWGEGEVGGNRPEDPLRHAALATHLRPAHI